MVSSKLARLACGDPNHLDSWLDASNYLKLAHDDTLKKANPKQDKQEVKLMEAIGELEMQNILMKFDPATGEERPYPSHAAQWREWHGGTAWLFDPWTGRRRDARDVGSDVHGLLIVPAGTLGMDMGGGCSEKDNVACA